MQGKQLVFRKKIQQQLQLQQQMKLKWMKKKKIKFRENQIARKE